MSDKKQQQPEDPKVKQLKSRLQGSVDIDDKKIKKITEQFPDNYEEVGKMLSKQSKVFNNLNNEARNQTVDLVCQLESPKDINELSQVIQKHHKELNKASSQQLKDCNKNIEKAEKCQTKLLRHSRQFDNTLEAGSVARIDADIRQQLEKNVEPEVYSKPTPKEEQTPDNKPNS